MLTIRDEQMLARALGSGLDSRVKDLLLTRWAQITEGLSEGDIAEVVHFVVAGPRESAAELELAIGFPVFSSEGAGFSPEWAEYHEGVAFELCWVFSDDGRGVIAIVPCREGMDAELLTLCRAHTPAHA